MNNSTKSYLEFANRLIPGGAQTASKSPSRYVQAPSSPMFVRWAKGCYFTDIEGREFLDFGMALGACILGYNDPGVNDAVREAINEGALFTLPSYREARTAEALLQYLPWAEQVRFGKTGTDVTTAAVRVARAYTNRPDVAHIGYHGWADWSMTRSPATGVGPGVSNSYGFGTQSNDLVALADMVTQGSVAAVVVEVAQRGILDEDLLRSLREVCDSTSTVLVFDEILSGFRYRMGSASEVVPDLACFGKSIGNGYSVSALVGRRDLMQVLDPGGVFFSGTSFGETTGLAACEATLRIMDQDRVPHQLGQIGRLLKVRINDIAEIDGSPEDIWAGDGARITQSFPWPGPASDLFQQECARRGVLFMGAHNLSCSHDEQAISRLVQVYEEVGSYIGDLDQDSYESMLEAPPTTVPYRMQ